MNKKIISLLFIVLHASSQAANERHPNFVNRRKNILLSAVDQPSLNTNIDANEADVPKERKNTPDDKEFRDIDAQPNDVQTEESGGVEIGVGKIMQKETPEIDDEETIDFNFENTSLDQLINYVADVFHYQFISPEILDPLPQGEKKIKGNLVSFKTNRSLSKHEAWDLFLTFLNMAGFGVTPDPQPNTFRILSFDTAKRAPLPTFIGVDLNKIPEDIADSDQLIRYVYFIENTTIEALEPMINQMKSPTATVLMLKEHRAILIIDRAYNTVSLMRIIKELDKVSMPQTMSVLKLRRAGAKEVAELYQALIKGGDEKAPAQNRVLQRKQPTSYYFPENVRVIAEERTNSLILLGPVESIKKIEDFVIQYIDVELDKSFSPLFVHNLRYADAGIVSEIMSEVTKIGSESGLRAIGGVRGTDKFLKPMTFTPDKSTNRIIIKADYEDYLKAKAIIEKLDEPQAQVAIEVLILSLSVSDMKILGTQLRTKQPCGTNGIFGNNVTWQTSGLFGGSGYTQEGVVVNSAGSGASRLLGDLINLVTTAGAGSTVVSLGDAAGAYAIIQALESINSTQTVANPFLLATNRTKATVEVGTTERVIASSIIQTGTDVGQDTYKDEAADLTVVVTPTINSDGMITLDLNISLESFLGVFNPAFVQKNTQKVVTKALVADKEVIAVGGLVQDTTNDTVSKVPILGDIPIIGWLFKNRNKQEMKQSLLILISTQIVRPDNNGGGDAFTLRHIDKYESSLSSLYPREQKIDPIHRWFFEDRQEDSGQLLDDFVFNRHAHATEGMAAKRKRNRKAKAPSKETNSGVAP